MRSRHIQILTLFCCAAAGAAAGCFYFPAEGADSSSGERTDSQEVRNNVPRVATRELPDDPKVRGWLARVMETPVERLPAVVEPLLADFPDSADQEPAVAEDLFFSVWLEKDEAGLLAWMGTVSGEDADFLCDAARVAGLRGGARLWPAVQQLCARREAAEEEEDRAESILSDFALGWAEGDPASFLHTAPGNETMEEWIPEAVRAFARIAPVADRMEIAEHGDPSQAMLGMADLMPELYQTDAAKAKAWLLSLENKRVRAAGIAAWFREHALTAPEDAVGLLAERNGMAAELDRNDWQEILALTARARLAASVALLQAEHKGPRRYGQPKSQAIRVSGGGSGGRIRIAATTGGSGGGDGGESGQVEPGRSRQDGAGQPPSGPLRPPVVREMPLDPDLADLAGEYGVGLDGPVTDRVAAALVEIRALPPAAASLAPPLLAEVLKACATRWSAGDMQEGLESVIRLPEDFRQQALREVLDVLVEADAPALVRALRSLPPDSLAAAGPCVQLAAASDADSAVDLLFRPSSEPGAVPAGYFGSCPPSPAAEAAARAAGPLALHAYAGNLARTNPGDAPGWAAALPAESAREACSGVGAALGLTDTAAALRWAQNLPAGPHREGALEGLAKAIRPYDRAAAAELITGASADTSNPPPAPRE